MFLIIFLYVFHVYYRNLMVAVLDSIGLVFYMDLAVWLTSSNMVNFEFSLTAMVYEHVRTVL